VVVAQDTLRSATDSILEAALLGDPWGAALAQFTDAAGGDGATLVRDEHCTRAIARAHDEFVLATESIAGPVSDYLGGLAPPDPRTNRVHPSVRQGFVTDYDQFTADEIARSPFYEDFLRPRRMRWHACALVDPSPNGGGLYLSLKRFVHQDHYSDAEIALIDQTLPTLRSAAAISRAVLSAESRGAGRVLGQRGEAVFEIDARGRVIRTNEPAVALVGTYVNLVAGRLVPALAQDETRLNTAIAAALERPARTAHTVLGTDVPGQRLVVRVLPVVGAARDIFGTAVGLLVASVWKKPEIPPPTLVRALREAFDLTGAESGVAAMVSLGVAPAEAARILKISQGTARNYLKSAMTKMGIGRQAELAAIVALLGAGD
jgi:DNA-binding CsgD family transcriptional regulator